MAMAGWGAWGDGQESDPGADNEHNALPEIAPSEDGSTHIVPESLRMVAPDAPDRYRIPNELWDKMHKARDARRVANVTMGDARQLMTLGHRHYKLARNSVQMAGEIIDEFSEKEKAKHMQGPARPAFAHRIISSPQIYPRPHGLIQTQYLPRFMPRAVGAPCFRPRSIPMPRQPPQKKQGPRQMPRLKTLERFDIVAHDAGTPHDNVNEQRRKLRAVTTTFFPPEEETWNEFRRAEGGGKILPKMNKTEVPAEVETKGTSALPIKVLTGKAGPDVNFNRYGSRGKPKKIVEREAKQLLEYVKKQQDDEDEEDWGREGDLMLTMTTRIGMMRALREINAEDAGEPFPSYQERDLDAIAGLEIRYETSDEERDE